MRAIRMFVFVTLSAASTAVAQAPSPASRAAATITTADLVQRVGFLASDELGGRDTPSPGLEKAAAWIAAEFKSFGLKPAGDSATFIQRWPYQSKSLDASGTRAELRGKDAARTLEYGSEYFVVPSPSVDSLLGDVTFAGVAEASTQPNPAFANKVVAFYTPGGELSSQWMTGAVQPAIVAALTSGARGVVLLLDPEFDTEDIAEVVASLGSASVPVPVLALRYDVAKALLRGARADLDALRAARSAEPRALAGAQIFVRTASSGISGSPPNVVAILEGSDPTLKNTYLVYSAHMDHVGIGRPDASGDSIYNGADDDASGTSAVVEIAQAFASMSPRPKRSIIFLLVSGEEKGLYGSAHFVEHPPVPINSIVANINLDMIGRNAPDSTVAVGHEFSSLGATVQSIAKSHPELKLTVAPDLWPEEQLFFRSDHFNFAKKEIPAIFFTSGLHADYHKPSDEAETIDHDKLARTAQLVFYLGNEIANNSEPPKWTEAGIKAVRGMAAH